MRTSPDFGRPLLRVRTPRVGPVPPASGRIDLRVVAVVATVLAVAVAVGLVALGTGDYPLSVQQVVGTLFGDGSRIERMVVLEWRMPRVLMALVLGAALGISGAIFQSLTRNPLGSPDILGFNTGAYTGALVVMLVLGGTGYYSVASGAIVGGIGTALLMYLFAFKRGVQGFRFIIVGIGLSAMLASVNTWLILKADLEEAMSAAAWGAGTLNGIGWNQAGPVLVFVVVLVPFLVYSARRIPILDLGDDAASALGVRAETVRLVLIVVGVSSTAIVAAAAGPISFVALAAPQLARRLTRTAGVAFVPSAAMGALLLVVSDLVAQRLFSPTALPVGVVTVSIGGMYLVWLLYREARRR